MSVLLRVILADKLKFSIENYTTSSRSSYFTTLKDTELIGYVVDHFDSPSLLSCGQHCQNTAWCTSTNFKLSSMKNGKGTCELNKHDFSVNSQNSNLRNQLGVTLSHLLKGCLVTGCMNDGSCLSDMKKNTFTCSCKIPWIGDRCEIMLPATNGYEFSGNCPEGSGAVFESSCFFIIDIPTASWNYARWTCENYGADLAVIKSVNENNIILNLVTNQPTVQALGVWIGLQRNFFQDYAFYWVDDTPLEYSAWAESQPSSTREECVHTVTEGQENGKWNDNYCGLNGRVSPKNFPFILCQKSI